MRILIIVRSFIIEYRIYELLGVFLGLLVVIIGTKAEYKVCGVLILIWNLYSVMLQRYNIIRIDEILKKYIMY